MLVSQGLTLVIVAVLIVLIVWWFFLPHDRGQVQATIQGGKQVVQVTVDGGYQPETVVLKQGIPAQIQFDRRDPSSCLEQVVFPDFGINQFLTEKAITKIDLDTSKPGQYTYACGMDMFHGQVIIK
ncbi:cupredoxin domain-containing protein [Ligilactobacillus equi]|nr:cupredoxin domain-containing protein [Ligilactobacillus equi]